MATCIRCLFKLYTGSLLTSYIHRFISYIDIKVVFPNLLCVETSTRADIRSPPLISFHIDMSFGWPGGGAELPLNPKVYGNSHMPPQMPIPGQMGMHGVGNGPQPQSNASGGFSSAIPRNSLGNTESSQYPAGSAVNQAPGASGVSDQVCNVWKKNFPYHMALLRQYITSFSFVTIDVKFPGIVTRPIGTFHSTSEFHYQTLRSNIDLVEPLQLGLTLTDPNGNVPPGVNHMGTWQFNFKFDPKVAMCTTEGLEVLKQSGLDLARHESEGIELHDFFECLTTSGLVLNPSVTWITFYSGYDLGLLVSQLINRTVPNKKEDYMELVKRFFPQIWDVKMLVKAFNLSSKNYLHEIAEDFRLFRAPVWSSAGTDSRLAALCFYEVMRSLGDHAFSVKNMLFGLEGEGSLSEDELPSQAQTAQMAQVAQVQAQAHAQAQAVAVQAQARGLVPGGLPGIVPPGSGIAPPMMPMPHYMFNSSANPQVGGRQVYFSN